MLPVSSRPETVVSAGFSVGFTWFDAAGSRRPAAIRRVRKSGAGNGGDAMAEFCAGAGGAVMRFEAIGGDDDLTSPQPAAVTLNL